MSDAAELVLAQRIQSGEDDAFADLQAELERPIRRFVRRLIGNSDAEDDIVQDVFISLYKNIGRIDPIANLRPYLYRIARNRCYDELRKQGRYQIVSLDDEPVSMWASVNAVDEIQAEPDEVAHWIFIHMEVMEAIERLPETQRQALILYAEEHLTYAEIADAMGVSMGTVKSRLYYAKRTLRQLLRPEMVELLDAEFA